MGIVGWGWGNIEEQNMYTVSKVKRWCWLKVKWKYFSDHRCRICNYFTVLLLFFLVNGKIILYHFEPAPPLRFWNSASGMPFYHPGGPTYVKLFSLYVQVFITSVNVFLLLLFYHYRK